MSEFLCMFLRKLVYSFLPPVVLSFLRKIKRSFGQRQENLSMKGSDGNTQALELYWDEEFAKGLDTWGLDNTWNEIQLLLVNCSGKILDIACGTGKTMEILSRYPKLDIIGCDISDFLLKKAEEKGIHPDKLVVTDATKMSFSDDSFDYAYSIGSLEHFTEEGILSFVKEAHRVTRYASFHMVPCSRNNEDNGWISPHQSYFNNSIEWWMSKYETVYKTVFPIRSKWTDDYSVGYWFVCIKEFRN